MEKVRCNRCGSIGYTASPEKVMCGECGNIGHEIMIRKRSQKIECVGNYLRNMSWIIVCIVWPGK